LIKDTGGHVSLSPPIEMTMGHGTPAIQDALDNGMRPSLSSDHAVTLSSDFFTLMRSTAIAQRYFVLQRGRNGEQNLPPLLTCREVLEFATVEGARCANLDGKVGTLSPGKDAQQCAGSGRQSHEPQPRRDRLYRRESSQMARQPRGRRRATRAPTHAGVP
jgi:cytosine/adenosine deaminase-related metal-dependent hydrolase